MDDLAASLHYRDLDEVPGLADVNTTAEAVADFCWERLAPSLRDRASTRSWYASGSRPTSTLPAKTLWTDGSCLRVAFVTVGDTGRETGGYLYNARVLAGLRKSGVEVEELVACGASPGGARAAAPRFGSIVRPFRLRRDRGRRPRPHRGRPAPGPLAGLPTRRDAGPRAAERRGPAADRAASGFTRSPCCARTASSP